MEIKYISNIEIGVIGIEDEVFTRASLGAAPRSFQYWLIASKTGASSVHVNGEGCAVHADGVVYDFPNSAIVDAMLSPSGRYVSMWHRYIAPGPDGEPCLNLHIFEVKTKTHKTSLSQKHQNGWNVEWSDDESLFARIVNNHIHVFSTATFLSTHKLHIEGVQSFSFSPSPQPSLCAFTPEQKSTPASIRIFPFNSIMSTAQKTFFRADSATFYWNKTGTCLLVGTHTDSDKTGQSYYGETHLYYMAVDGGFECKVALDKTGPIHGELLSVQLISDVCWSPNSIHFSVIYGTMPSKATLFGQNAEQVYSFPDAARNYVRFCPTGRLLLIAGFGNLAGDLDIWDLKTMKKGAAFKASNASLCEWSPDGRQFMTATLYRRLKVDNGIKVYSHTGKLIHDLPLKELHQVAWKPTAVEKFTKRALEKFSSTENVAVKMAAYRPPGARGMPTIDIFDPANMKKKVPGYTKYPKNNKKKSADTNGTAATVVSAAVIPDLGLNDKASEKERKIKVCMKKLKQIEGLKARVSKGEQMEITQLNKIESEDLVRKELDDLHL